MEIHKMVKDTLRDHKKKIELLQWAITSGIATLIYPEYLMRIKQKQTPIRRIFVPSIKSVREILSLDGEFMTCLSEHLIDDINDMLNSDEYKDFAVAPEFELFSCHDRVEILKTIFDLYMVPNISTRLPETIAKKFRIGDPKQQLMVEANDIDLFNRKCPISTGQFGFMVEEIVLQLLTLIPTMRKEVELPESNAGIYLTSDEVVTIGNDNGICPIHINRHIMSRDKDTYDSLMFITNTHIQYMDWSENALEKNGEIVTFRMDTGIFNQVAITRFKGIETGNTEDTKGD